MEEVTVDDILSRLDKDTLSKVRLGKDIEKTTIPTASFGINNTIGGGLRLGKQATWWGGEQSGKSAIMLQTIGINQRLSNLPCAWIDAEHSYDRDWADRLGVDNDRLIVSEVSTIAEAADLQIRLIREGIKLIVLDSTSALMPRSYLDGDELKDFEKTGQLGQVAADLGRMCKMVQGRNFTCSVNHISQVRIDVGNAAMQKPFKPVGGKEVEHTDSLRIRLFSSKSDREAIMGTIPVGDTVLEERIGRRVTWKIDKNKLNGRGGTDEYELYTMGDFVGVDKNSELVSYGVKYGVIEKGGAWYTIFGERFQGGSKVVKYLRDNPEIAEKVEAEVNAKSI
jgi:recombination protein RecA